MTSRLEKDSEDYFRKNYILANIAKIFLSFPIVSQRNSQILHEFYIKHLDTTFFSNELITLFILKKADISPIIGKVLFN